MATKKVPAKKKATVKQRPAGSTERPPAERLPAVSAELEEVERPNRRQAPFHIVAIGSSAGGVEALEEFFRHLPDCPDSAFVIITHQSPNHTSLLPELLRRWTSLPVMET